MVCDFPSFPKKNGKSPKEENAAPSLRPENFAGHYPPRNSLPAVAQTGAAADATGEIFSLRAPASVQRGGEAAPVLDLPHMLCGLHFQRERFAYTDADPHRDDCPSFHARGSFVSRTSTLPCANVQPHAGADPHTMNDLLSYTQRFPLLMLLPIRTREARRIGPGSAGPPSFPLYAGAARRVNVRRSRTPLSPYARAQHGGKSPLADSPFPADGNTAPRLA